MTATDNPSTEPIPAPASESECHYRKLAETRGAFCHTYAHLFALPVICLCFFTLYGPRQRPDLAIHKFTALMEAAMPIPIFGDGSTGRDYTYIDDIVAGVLAALERIPQSASRPVFEIFDLVNSHPVRLEKFVALLERVTGHEAIREYKPLQLGDMRLTWADISRTTRLLSFRPSTNLEDGLIRLVRWYRLAVSERPT